MIGAETDITELVNAGLILEGGGMRGVYTAGVLDFFIDKEIWFRDVYGVSAGACHAASYLSRQKGRAFRVSTDYLKDSRYCSFRSLLKTGDLFGAEMCYDLIPNQLDQYDYCIYNQFKGKFFTVVTNCMTGEAEYLQITDMKRDINAIQASASLPLVSRNVLINGQEYLDGGMSDSVPIRQSMKNGNNKNVVVLTRCRGYRKEPNRFMSLFKAKYKGYPNVVENMKTRHTRYNETMDFIEEQENQDNIFVIRPQKEPGIKRIEKDIDKMKLLYEEGYKDAEACFESLINYLNIQKTEWR